MWACRFRFVKFVRNRRAATGSAALRPPRPDTRVNNFLKRVEPAVAKPFASLTRIQNGSESHSVLLPQRPARMTVATVNTFGRAGAKAQSFAKLHDFFEPIIVNKSNKAPRASELGVNAIVNR